MKAKALLWKQNQNKDNTYQILIYCYHNKIKKYYPTGIFIQESNWSEANELVIGIPQQLKAVFNQKIQQLKSHFLLKMAEGVPANKLGLEPTPSAEELVEKRSFLKFLDKLIDQEESNIEGLRPGTLKNYKSTSNRLIQYCESRNLDDITFDDINMDFYYDFASFYKHIHPGPHGFSNRIKIIKRVLKTAYKRGLHKNRIYENAEFKRIRQKTVGKIYLNEDEIKLLENLDLSAMPVLDLERDRFLISYYFIMRWEDSTKIDKKLFVIDDEGELNIDYVSGKTNTRCVLPVSSRARKLLEKRRYSFKGHTNQNANRVIKDIGSIAGISQVLTQGNRTAPKFKFITTHTARRSAATNLYLKGMDLETIARLGGWTDLQTLRIYLRASGLEVAQNAKKFDFFQ